MKKALKPAPDSDALFRDIFQQVLMQLEEGIEIFDKNGNLLFCNLSHAKLDGSKIEELLGKHLTEIYHLDQSTSPFLQMLQTGKPIYNFCVEYTNFKGKENTVICNVQPITRGNEIIGGAVITKDFTKTKEMLETILDLQKQLINNMENRVPGQTANFSRIIGKSPALLDAVKWAQTAAETSSPVLIFGETGTGKEIFARTIHENSSRGKKPFLAINCAALPENLLESILFGTVKGAFTGALDQKGLFEQAHNGTLLLDELNSMPVGLQGKLLRVLEDKKVRRLGDKTETPVDVRIIASCNVDPCLAVKNGQLRRDIFYRLAVIYIPIPPLRERREDLGLITKYFINEYNQAMQKNVLDVDEEVRKIFHDYAWPGNVRQLKHCLECAIASASKEEKYITLKHLPNYFIEESKVVSITDSESLEAYIIDKTDQIERNKIIAALKKNNGNISRTARELGISRQRLQYWMKKLAIIVKK